MIDRPLHLTTIEHPAALGTPTEVEHAAWILLVDLPGGVTRRVPARACMSMGRAETCDIPLDEASLSRVHASFRLDGDGMLVTDLGSRNGVVVEGARVAEARLLPGQQVALGAVTVTVHRLTHRRAAGSEERPSARLPRSEPEPVAQRQGAAMSELEALIARVAQRNLSVLVTGETGSGKEHAARALHERSPRASGPLRIVNCAAIPATLIESFLFGHERGAFTGANSQRQGVFEEADGGTVFLDEIGELSAPAQAALLRVLETRNVVRLGSTRELPIDVRVVAATHRDLAEMVARGEFRLDLLHRLNAVVLRVPALRERSDEIEPLARLFLARAATAWDMACPEIAREVWPLLCAYPWPGNVRELRNVIERALALCDGKQLGLVDLPEHLRATPGNLSSPTIDATARQRTSHRDRVREQELEAVRAALVASGGNRKLAAESLKMPLRTFQRRLSELSAGTEGDEEP